MYAIQLGFAEETDLGDVVFKVDELMSDVALRVMFKDCIPVALGVRYRDRDNETVTTYLYKVVSVKATEKTSEHLRIKMTGVERSRKYGREKFVGGYMSDPYRDPRAAGNWLLEEATNYRNGYF